MAQEITVAKSSIFDLLPASDPEDSASEWASKVAACTEPSHAFAQVCLSLGVYGHEYALELLSTYLTKGVISKSDISSAYMRQVGPVCTLERLALLAVRKKQLFSLEEVFKLDCLREKSLTYGDVYFLHVNDITWIVSNKNILQAVPSAMLVRVLSYITSIPDRLVVMAEIRRRLSERIDRKILNKSVPVEDDVKVILQAIREDPSARALKLYVWTFLRSRRPRKGSIREHVLEIIKQLLHSSSHMSPGFAFAHSLAKWYVCNIHIPDEDREWLLDALYDPTMNISRHYSGFVSSLWGGGFLDFHERCPKRVSE